MRSHPIDYTPDRNLNRVAHIAADLGQRIREEDPHTLYNELVKLCAQHPAKATQLVMCLLAWFNPDEPVSALTARAVAITEPRNNRRSA